MPRAVYRPEQGERARRAPVKQREPALDLS